jgi:hypothetical protein
VTAGLKIADTDVQVINLVEIEAELRPMETTKLRNVLAESMGNAAMWIARAAICVKLMEERGEQLVGIHQVSLLRKVASGQVLPEAVLAYGESPARETVLQAPLPDQKKLVKTPVQPVVEPTPNGQMTTRMVDLTKAPKEVVRQVVGPEGIRTPEMQIAYLATQNLQSKAKAGKLLPASAPVLEPLTREVKVKLTENEWHALNMHASDSSMSLADFIRKTLSDARLLVKRKK